VSLSFRAYQQYMHNVLFLLMQGHLPLSASIPNVLSSQIASLSQAVSLLSLVVQQGVHSKQYMSRLEGDGAIVTVWTEVTGGPAVDSAVTL
jgi:hypothetical protein